MSEYVCTHVSGDFLQEVAPSAAARRTHVPSGARPHLALVKPTADGQYALDQLLTVDDTTGTALYHVQQLGSKGEGRYGRHIFSTVPSQRRIGALLAAGTHTGSDVGHVFVSDDIGNIFSFPWSDVRAATDHHSSSSPAAGQKRPRAEEAPPQRLQWRPLVPARTPLPSQLPHTLEADPLLSLFSVSRGTAGWTGLAQLPSAPQWLLNSREFFFDVRVVDVERHEVVRTYGTTHAPTGMAPMKGEGELGSCVLLAEGCLATLYDVRCASAAMTLAAALQPEPVSAPGEEKDKEKPSASHAPRNDGGNNNNGLTPGRFTSTSGLVSDACALHRHHEVALSIDRSLCTFDVRKFTKHFTSSNVLKYNIATIASVAGGRAVVCSGIDSEVRLVELEPKASSATTEGQESGEANKKPQPQLQKKGSQKDDGDNDAELHPVSTFRTRLNTSVSCRSRWQGGWVTSANCNGAAAVGVSMDKEVFISY